MHRKKKKKHTQLKLLGVDFVRRSVFSCPQLFGCCCSSFQNKHFFYSVHSCHLVLFFFFFYWLFFYCLPCKFGLSSFSRQTHTHKVNAIHTQTCLVRNSKKKYSTSLFFFACKTPFAICFLEVSWTGLQCAVRTRHASTTRWCRHARLSCTYALPPPRPRRSRPSGSGPCMSPGIRRCEIQRTSKSASAAVSFTRKSSLAKAAVTAPAVVTAPVTVTAIVATLSQVRCQAAIAATTTQPEYTRTTAASTITSRGSTAPSVPRTIVTVVRGFTKRKKSCGNAVYDRKDAEGGMCSAY